MSLELLHTLYQKVGAFEAGLSSSVRERLQCQKGCSQCCMVELSVFELEAESIKDWFQLLTLEEKKSLRQRLNSTPGACTFLHQNECLIYPARPLICRTHGLAIKLEDEKLDICPLNIEAIQNIQPKDILNLKTLNHVLVSLEHQAAKGFNRERVSLRAIAETILLDE